jgi:exodeoxyribonuclease V alpha subunit
VHKAQGLEYDYIVMPLVTGFYHQLQRNLLYTAITRARKQVVLVGHHDALVRAVYNAKEDDRATLFLDRLLAGVVVSPSE